MAPLTPSWRKAFLAAGRLTAARPPDELRERFQVRAAPLDAVRVPALVHFDLWDGNILLEGDGAAARIGGLIDGERVFWGDPVADFVSLALLGDIERDHAFLSGYHAAGGQVTFDEPTRQRLSLYRAYLYLIMLVEADPRGFGAGRRRWLAEQVAPLLTSELDRRTGR